MELQRKIRMRTVKDCDKLIWMFVLFSTETSVRNKRRLQILARRTVGLRVMLSAAFFAFEFEISPFLQKKNKKREARRASDDGTHDFSRKSKALN